MRQAEWQRTAREPDGAGRHRELGWGVNKGRDIQEDEQMGSLGWNGADIFTAILRGPTHYGPTNP